MPVSGNVLPPTSIYSSSLSGLTRCTGDTQTGAPTSISSYSGTQRSGKNPNPVLGVLGEIQEDEEQPMVGTQLQISARLSSNSNGREWDEGSLISQMSTAYTPEQRDDIIARFSGAMLKSLRSNSNYSAASDSSRQHLLPHLRSALKDFAEDAAAETDAASRTQAKARKLVRRLRREISGKLQDRLLDSDRATERRRVPIDLLDTGQMNPSEKIKLWDATAPYWAAQEQHQAEVEETKFEMDSSQTTMESEDSEDPAGVATGLYETSINPAEILKYFTGQSSFKNLVRTTEKLFERYHSQKMDLIRNRVSLALRRLPDKKAGAGSPLNAVFNVDWDLKDYLENNYDDGVNQPLDRMLAVTGVIENAQLCSVGDYVEWCWPRHKSQLLRALEQALTSPNGQAKNTKRERTVYLTSTMARANSDDRPSTSTVRSVSRYSGLNAPQGEGTGTRRLYHLYCAADLMACSCLSGQTRPAHIRLRGLL